MMNDTTWAELYERAKSTLKIGQQDKYNITIERDKDKTLEFSIVQQDDECYYTCPALKYEPEEAQLLDNIAAAVGETFGCRAVWKASVDKYIIRYKNEKGIIDATCVEGISFAEVAEKYKNYDVISIERISNA